MKSLSIRNVSPQLSAALHEEKVKLGMSLNSTVLYLLSESLGLTDTNKPKSNGLGRLAGGWSEEDLQEFNKAISDLREIDEEMWR